MSEPVSFAALMLGVSFWVYLIHRTVVERVWQALDARRPLALFLIANVSAVACTVLLWLVVKFANYVFRPANSYEPPIAILGICGLMGWLLWWIFHSNQRAQMHAAFERQTHAKLQMWLQDLVIAIVAYGACMTVIRNALNRSYDERMIPVFAILEFLNHAVAFCVALEACRVCSFSSAWARGLFVAACIGACEVPLYVFLYFVAWLACRHALSKMPMRVASV